MRTNEIDAMSVRQLEADYEAVRDAIIEHLAPVDDDIAESAILVAAVEHAAERLAAAEREIARCQQDELDYGAEVMALREANAQLVLEAKAAEQREQQARAIIEGVQEFIVLHAWDTSVGHRIHDYLTEQARAWLAAGSPTGGFRAEQRAASQEASE